MTWAEMEENLRRIRQAGKEILGVDVQPDFTSHKKHPYMPSHTGKIWVKEGGEKVGNA